VYERKGNFKQAHHYMEQHRVSVDSLFARQKLKIIQEVEAEFKTKEQAAELELKETQLARQRTFVIASSLLALVLLGFGIFAYRTAQRRQHTNALLQEQSEQLKSLDKAKSRFFANISHELRTPLTLIIAPLDNALKRVKDKFIKDDLKLAHSNSKKLLSLVNEILDLTKLESGQMRLNESSIPLEGFLKRILFSYHSLANIRGFMLSFQYYLDHDLVVKTDAAKLEKIINNLLSNAFKYSNAGGVITLKVAAKDQQQMKISIQDQGKGIAADELNRIFDRFYQVESKDEPLQGGTGIGLSLARELAEALGGTLEVESALDKGTTFTVIIPLVKGILKSVEQPEIIESTPEIAAYSPVSFNAKESHILIVEDNPEMSKFLTQMLSPHYQCTTAADGKKALKMLQSRSFDLITSDVMMPNMDGFTLLKSVRDLQNSQSTPFILLTARSLEEDKLKGLRLGVDDYITKPFSTNQLIARINNLLTNQQKRQSWAAEQKATTNEPPLSAEQEMLKKAEQFVIKNISNPQYRVENLASDMSYSRRQLSRIIQKMTGLTPVEFIREIRLLKAYQMLEQRQYLTISEVRFEVGFENASYFTKVFTKRFGVKPSEVVELV
jgi:signal transduction histidine kinase/DNA-binding response OmpR family regulator